jgi:hypothetical protein
MTNALAFSKYYFVNYSRKNLVTLVLDAFETNLVSAVHFVQNNETYVNILGVML